MANGPRPQVGRSGHSDEPALVPHDELTGLANRALWTDRAEMALREAARTGRRLGVLYVAVDGFSAIRETCGDDVADAVLREVARRMQGVVRPYDTVARSDGDEFLILCPLLAHGEDGEQLARRLQQSMTAPVRVDGQQIEVTIGIGIAFAEGGEIEPGRVVRRADTALYSARDRGPGRVEVYHPDLHAARERQADVLDELEQAHANGDFVVFFQPIVEAGSRRVVALEALLRWENSEVGTLTPRFFMDVLLANELMHRVGADVLRVACAAGVDLMAHGHRLAVHVNVSAPELSRPGLAERVRAALELSGLPAELLVLELNEAGLMSITDPVRQELMVVRETGVRVAIDDFGTRYSRRAHLADLPIDLLKLDREVVADVTASASARAVGSGVRTMAAGLGIQAIAAGVETDAHAEVVERLGYGQLQGNAFGPPAPLADVLTRLLASDEPVVQLAGS